MLQFSYIFFKCNNLFPLFPHEIFFIRLQYGCIYQLLPALEKRTNFSNFRILPNQNPLHSDY